MALEEKIWEVDTRIKKIAFGGLTPSEIGDLGIELSIDVLRVCCEYKQFDVLVAAK